VTSSQRPSTSAQRVFRGFTVLSETDRQAVIRLINDYQRQTLQQRESVRKSFENIPGVVLGPLGGGCECCGRG
jgi:hypothetical protein